ncbi:hypothetical protein ACIRRI_34545 [Streptomyces mirabilis]|uniref:hypothetical protein n=1 Tax=Streptomyces mirabilis TaxID=68239 RepID=UPI00382817F0
MPPIGSLENLLSDIRDEAARSLLAIAPQGDVGHARRNAAEAVAAARAERREHDEVSAWLAKRDLPRTPCP